MAKQNNDRSTFEKKQLLNYKNTKQLTVTKCDRDCKHCSWRRSCPFAIKQ